MQRTNIIILDSYLESLQLEEIQMIQEVELIAEQFSMNKATKLMKEAIPKIKKILKEHGISGDVIEKQGKAASAKLHTYYKQGKKPEEISKSLVKSAFKSLQAPLKKIKASLDTTDETEIGIGKKIAVSLSCFMMVIFINAFMLGFNVAIFGPELGVLLLVVVCGPMLEEAVKNYFIQKGMPMIGTGVVFGLELIMTTMRLTALGLSLPKILIIRVIVLAMHFATTMIQKHIMDRADKNNEAEMAKYAFAAWSVGVAIHMTWNLYALVYNQELLAWMK